VAGLTLAAALPREDVRDAFCGRSGRTLDELPDGSSIATGSPRRIAQLRRLHRRHAFVPIRGNVDTRLKKIHAGEADGVILARAGLARLGLLHAVTELLPVEVCLPAPGQGAIGLECREDDHRTRGLLNAVNDPSTMDAILAERAFLRGLGGGCRTPIAAYGKIAGDRLDLFGFAGDPGGDRFIASAGSGPRREAESIGRRLAGEFLAKGAGKLVTG
jgi:hydroxymethylbilane synthase